jgi:NTP pyrophosphatase (non-canonical NTP hydrolase)
VKGNPEALGLFHLYIILVSHIFNYLEAIRVCMSSEQRSNRIDEFDHYQTLTGQTAIGYSQSGAGVTRDEDDEAYLDELEAEIGDVLWYLARLAAELDVQLSDVAGDNIDKLLDRDSRDQITGQGDDR